MQLSSLTALLALVPLVSLAAPGSEELRYAKQNQVVLGHEMAYVDVGRGDPIVFLHGNPTSSYLWRNVIPHLEGKGRCIAPDLMGMGDSAKLPPQSEDGRDRRYGFLAQRRFMAAFLASVGADQRVIFVLHDWGSALGFDWTRRNRAKVRAIAFMEAIVSPVSYSDMDFLPSLMFRALRGPLGEFLILRRNFFVERVLPASVQRELSEAEMDAYRAPFLEAGEARRATLSWPREVPIDGEPADVHAIVAEYSSWLPESADLPKLFINAEPGALITGEVRSFVRSFPNQQEVSVAGIHFIQEDSPDEIGRAIAHWIDGLDEVDR